MTNRATFPKKNLLDLSELRRKQSIERENKELKGYTTIKTDQQGLSK
jgi:hypothetical protein